MKSQSYRDLLVWQKAIALCTEIYQACQGFPKSELYALSDQMRRAAVSVPSNIAEGQAREHVGEFLNFLSIANGSLAELDTQRIIATNLGFISADISERLDQQITEVRKMLFALTAAIRKAR